ncbi:flippase [Treponema sp.]|uniref:flippase n=1 Tax=Treponema sp. TaxID=166 RepID=UPI00257A1DD0|nr:flippase [Treponema sp.]MBE6353846.1 flippase [Treponema sp.]
MKEKSLKKNAILNIIRTLMSIIFPIITFPYASKILLPEGIGKVNFVNSIVSYFTIISLLGIGTYGTRESAKYRDNKEELSKVCSEMLAINVITTIIAYLLYFLFIFFNPSLQDYRVFLLIASITILFSTFGIGWFYSGIEEYEYITIRTIIFQIVSIVLLFLFVKKKEDVLIYLLIGIISNAGSNILNLIHSRKYINIRFNRKLELKKHLKPTFLLFSIALITSIYNTLDTSMLGFLSTNQQVGYYTAATKINKMILTLVTSISAVMFPRLSYYIKQNKMEDFNNLLHKNLSVIILISLPCTIGLNILSKPIVLLFSGTNFIPAVPIMKFMNPIIIIISLSNFIGSQVFVPLGKEKNTIIAVTCGSIINFSLNLILIPKYFALGAAIATITAESIVAIIQIFNLKRIISLTSHLLEIVQYILATAIMGIIVKIFSNLIDSNILSILVCVLAGALIYYISLIILRNQIIITLSKDLLIKLINKKKSIMASWKHYNN